MKTESKIKATAYAKSIFPDAAPAYQSAGELALPLELVPATGDLAGEGLLSLLKSGFRGLAGGFKRTLGDKKRLGIVIALAVVWLLVNLFVALGISPLPVRVFSWLTAITPISALPAGLQYHRMPRSVLIAEPLQITQKHAHHRQGLLRRRIAGVRST